MKRVLSILPLALASVATPGSAAVDPLADSTQGFFHYPYRLYTPAAATVQPVPLIVFLGHAGDVFRPYAPEADEYNVTQVLQEVPPIYIQGLLEKAASATTPAYVVAPQFIERIPYDDGYYQWGHEAPKLLEFVEYVRTALNVDPSRIYVTGLSSGGTGVWFALGQSAASSPAHPMFAASAILSGRDVSSHGAHTTVNNSNPILPAFAAGILDSIADIPTWIFHGELDGTVPLLEAQDMGAQLALAGGAPLFSPIPEIGHSNLWAPVYNDDPAFTGAGVGEPPGSGLYGWLFAQTQASPPPLLPLLLPPRPGSSDDILPGQVLLLDLGEADVDPGTSAPQVHAIQFDPGQTRWWNRLGWNGDGYSSDVAYAMARGIATPVHSFGLVTSDNQRTRTAVVVTDDFLVANVAGESGPGGVYPAFAQSDSWVVGSFTGHAEAEQNPGALRITQLSPGGLYRIALFASRDNAPEAYRTTRYTIGSAQADLDANDNLTNRVVFDEVVAAPDGTIEIGVAVVPGDEGGTGLFGYLGVLEIEAIAGSIGTYSRWIHHHEFTGNGGAPGGDPDGDGVLNLLEYALGSDPFIPGRMLTPSELNAEYGLGFDPPAPTGPTTVTVAYDSANEKLTLTYPRLANDVIYTVETSTLDEPITWDAAPVNQNDPAYNPGAPYVTASVPAGALEKRFLRLRVELP